MQFGARSLRNPSWTRTGVVGQYSDGNPHADLYRFLELVTDVHRHLNVGYSRVHHVHLHPSTHLRLIDRLGDGLLAQLHSTNGHRAAPERLLDIGAGRGGAALRARSRYGWRVTGVDFCPNNARVATANARAAGVWPAVRFLLADAHTLPVAAGSFRLAWSIEAPAHFADKGVFLDEAARVLAPGGALAFCDLLAVWPAVAASRADRAAYERFLEVWDVPYLESRDSYVDALRRAGLELRRSEIVTRRNLDILRRWCGTFLHVSRVPRLYHALRGPVERRTGANLDHVLDHVRRSHDALSRGLIDYGLFWALRRV